MAAFENYVRSLSPQVEYRMMNGASHFPMLEKPAEFNALLTALLRKHGLIGPYHTPNQRGRAQR